MWSRISREHDRYRNIEARLHARPRIIKKDKGKIDIKDKMWDAASTA